MEVCPGVFEEGGRLHVGDLVLSLDRCGPNYGDVLDVVCGRHMYQVASVAGRDVLDVGASCGDSVALFVSLGARRVVAVEPDPCYYEAVVSFAAENGLAGRVVPVLAAVSRESGRALSRGSCGAYGLFAPSVEGVEVELVTLGELVGRYGLVGAVLKMDCEGCEAYPSAEEYALFSEAVVECHGNCEEVGRLLGDAGFSVETVWDRGWAKVLWGKK